MAVVVGVGGLVACFICFLKRRNNRKKRLEEFNNLKSKSSIRMPALNEINTLSGDTKLYSIEDEKDKRSTIRTGNSNRSDLQQINFFSLTTPVGSKRKKPSLASTIDSNATSLFSLQGGDKSERKNLKKPLKVPLEKRIPNIVSKSEFSAPRSKSEESELSGVGPDLSMFSENNELSKLKLRNPQIDELINNTADSKTENSSTDSFQTKNL